MSPRNASRPMAFTAWEFIRGALGAYGIFMTLTAFFWLWMPLMSFVALFFAAPIALLTLLLVGAPLSLAAGVLLRPVRGVGWHLLAHGLVAAISGAAGIVIGLSVTRKSSFSEPHLPDLAALDTALFPALAQAVITIPAVLLAWFLTSHLALAADAASIRREALA